MGIRGGVNSSLPLRHCGGLVLDLRGDCHQRVQHPIHSLPQIRLSFEEEEKENPNEENEAERERREQRFNCSVPAFSAPVVAQTGRAWVE